MKTLSYDTYVKRMTIDGTNYHAVAGTTDTLTTNSIDTQGWGTVRFIVSMGAITGSGTCAVKAQSSSDDASTDAFADITGATMTTFSGSGDSDKISILEIHVNKAERYIKLLFTRATANVVIESLIAELGNRNGLLPVAKSTLTDSLTVV